MRGKEREKEEAEEVNKVIRREKIEIWEELERESLVWQRRGFCIGRIGS